MLYKPIDVLAVLAGIYNNSIPICDPYSFLSTFHMKVFDAKGFVGKD